MAGLLGTSTLFSAVTGTVVRSGKPVAGATVEQMSQHGSGEPQIRSVQTGPDGSFAFDAITKKKGVGSLLPVEFVAAQELIIRFEGNEYIGWIYTKRDPKPGSETDGKDFSLVCDLDMTPDYEGQYYGVCRLVES